MKHSAPAVDDHGTGVRKVSLLSVDLSEEAEDSPRLLGDSVVRPAEVLVVPYLPGMFGLRVRENKTVHKRFIYIN